MRRRAAMLLLAGLLALVGAGLGPAARADEADPEPFPLPAQDELTGRDIYERVVENRFDAYVQESTLVSGDRGDRTQSTKLRMHWRDFRDGNGDGRDDDGGNEDEGVLSKTLVKYTHPFDIRHSGYLIINHAERANDQFVYLPTRRKIRRVNLRGEAVYGTDFSFEDVVPREVQDSTYRRLPDEQVGDRRTYVVEAHPKDTADSEYSRFRVYVDPETFVPLRTRYWDDADLEVKRLEVDPDSIREYDGIFVPMAMTMHNLQLDTWTTLRVTALEPNPDLHHSTFDLRRLESH